MLCEGTLEKPVDGDGAINLVVDRVGALRAPARPADVHELPAEIDDADDFRAVAPEVQSFASGRRR